MIQLANIAKNTHTAKNTNIKMLKMLACMEKKL